MSRIDELIECLCPDGVEYRFLLDVADVLYGYPCDASQFNEQKNGLPLARIRNIKQGTSDIFTSEEVPEKYYLSKGDLLIGMDGNFHVSNWKMDNGVLCQRVCKIFSFDKEIVLDRYLFHLLILTIKEIEDAKPSGTVKHLLNKDLKSVVIPIPPLVIQEEIVRVLDSFAELEAELETELEARRKQYAYYRDQLLTFSDGEVEWTTLGEVMTVARGASPRPISRYICSKKDGVPWIKIGDVLPNAKTITSTKQYVTQEGVSKSRFLKQGSLVLSNSMSFGRPYILNIDGCIHDGWISLTDYENTFNRDYLYHLLRSKPIQHYWSMKASSGTVSNLNADIVRSTRLPLPSLSEQRRIVDILDKFDALTNDISAGLPAEIEARRKQYEYYRDKLLTFKELEAS